MSFDIRRDEPIPGVVCLRFENQYETTSTFMRLQEFYESPIDGVRGTFFTVETFMDRYAEQKGNFTYTFDWGGFNVPGHVVNEFFSLFQHDLLEKELHLLNIIRENPLPERYYVVAIYGEDCFDHEMAHALYYLKSDYKERVDSLVESIPKKTRNKLQQWLVKRGYSEPQLVDEINAYIGASDLKELHERFNGKMCDQLKFLQPLRDLYREFSGKEIIMDQEFIEPVCVCPLCHPQAKEHFELVPDYWIFEENEKWGLMGQSSCVEKSILFYFPNKPWADPDFECMHVDDEVSELSDQWIDVVNSWSRDVMMRVEDGHNFYNSCLKAGFKKQEISSHNILLQWIYDLAGKKLATILID